MEETQYIELKEKFKIQDIKKELSGLLNAAPINKLVKIYVGKTNSGKDVKLEKVDPSKREDLVSEFLNQFSVRHSIRKFGNKDGIVIEAISNNVVVVANGVYYRHGTSKRQVDEAIYKSLLKSKKINLAEITKNELNIDDYQKLEKYIANKNVNKNLVDVLFNSMVIFAKDKKIVETNMSAFVKDNANFMITLGTRKISGTIFNVFEEALKEVISWAKSHEFYQKESGIRLRISQKINNYEVILREMTSNIIAHSSFRGLDNGETIKILLNDQGIFFYNKHTQKNAYHATNTWRLPHKASNPMIFTFLRLLNICEGNVIGFNLFSKNKEYIHLEITESDFVIGLKGV